MAWKERELHFGFNSNALCINRRSWARDESAKWGKLKMFSAERYKNCWEFCRKELKRTQYTDIRAIWYRNKWALKYNKTRQAIMRYFWNHSVSLSEWITSDNNIPLISNYHASNCREKIWRSRWSAVKFIDRSVICLQIFHDIMYLHLIIHKL